LKTLFNQTVEKLLEDFNIYPYAQNAANAGPDQGMTTADINNTFPSKVGTVFLKKIKKKKKLTKQPLSRE
jgi:hypothetical protein